MNLFAKNLESFLARFKSVFLIQSLVKQQNKRLAGGLNQKRPFNVGLSRGFIPRH